MQIRAATPDDHSLPTFDFTKFTAINTCPTWGLIRYERHLTLPRAGRKMALEIGSAAHEVFAAARYVTLFEGDHHDLSVENANKAFGIERVSDALVHFNSSEPLDYRRRNFCLAILDSGSFYDDPGDRRRTRQNLSDACEAYLQNYNYEAWQPVVLPELGFVGAEIPFDLVVEHDGRKFRFIGRIDGLIDNKKFREIEVHENKTGARINDAWAQSFHMSHQVTGYLVAATHILQREEFISSAIVHGLQIPLPRNFEYGGIATERVTRNDDQFRRWIDWTFHTLDIFEQYKDDPLEAPKYTHSCNRYFQPCSMIPFCSSSREEQLQIMESEYVVDEWSPLHEQGGE